MPSRPFSVPWLVVLLACLAAACGGRSEAHPPVRIADLLESPPAATVTVATDLAVGPSPRVLEVDLAAEQVSRLRVRARGDAELVKLVWRLGGERRFTRYRALTFPVIPDGEEHVYDVDLRREPYWTGRIAALQWSTRGGDLEVAEVTGRGTGSAQRVTSLKGLTVPSLPGAARLEAPLPPDLPARAHLAAWVGLLPRFDRGGTTARFRAWVETDDGERREWLDHPLAGDDRPGWVRVRVPVEVPAGGRLVLEARAERGGQPLPEGSAVWGSPMLVPESAGRGSGPNLVVVVVDTLRADVLGAYGDGGGLTPHLDELAAEAVRFDDLSAPAPWTLPSITTLLTGYPPQVHGAGRRIGDFAPTALGDGPETLAEELAARGLYTAAVYNNIYLNPSFGLEQGFDEFAWLERDDDVLVDRALERLAELADRRFFLFLHLFGPHHPYAPPEPWCRRVAGAFAPDYDGALGCRAERRDVPTLGGEPPPPEDRRWVEGLYRAEVAFTDEQLGRLRAGLERLGLADDTVLLVVSDHGEAFWDRLETIDELGYVQADHGHAHYRELVRVPGLLRAPGLEPGVVARPVELADFFPTLFGLLGFEPPPTSGHDLVPLLAGGPPVARRTLVSDFLLYGPARWAARRGPWKLVMPEEGPAGGSLPRELYDLAADPAERRNLIAERSDVAAALARFAESERAEREALRRRFLAGEQDVLNSAYLEWNHITKLRSLGYLK
ncbi:MAG TPA: sulfatase [Thermoanaerobaculia bacterium]|nr:sulfatase [Thermoanaerobaculia bacterium]